MDNIPKLNCCNILLGTIQCDNSCGTYYCEKCNKEYYVKNNKFYKGHSNKCGIFE